ncbi:prolyl oligopeptidase family serine peptidase [Branchiibius sp. NY16-3462-2]|uniref:S9 family peptidase n=1 Tax=Branchiibius sp. NY16-3462-2 TaxID=1807500 RepID=UPI00079C0D86|nr:prolyl oligopeptidase family serine peptidase [Branchiibius sp. NY16-3462-2]KYH46280.1 hypothetical protein AZH51_11755 [Branchiibius sp. NY16-3462-2]
MPTAPYGSWESIVTTSMLTSQGVGLSSPILDGETLFWLESRPSEGGRVGLWRQAPGGAPELVVAAPFNVRTRVHEYGGGAYAARMGVVVFSDFESGRVYQVTDDGPVPLTPGSSDFRYADLRVHAGRGLVLAVREDHSGGGEPVNTLVALRLGQEGAGTVLVSGADFYSDPQLSADCELAWTQWDHPAMPWDATLIQRGVLHDDLTVSDVVPVAGGPGESALHPRWAPGGDLIFVSDRTGWWNLYAQRGASVIALHPDEAEYAGPQWVFGLSPFVALSTTHVLAARTSAGTTSLVVIERGTGESMTVLPAGGTASLTSWGGTAAALIAAPDCSTRLATIGLESGQWTDVRVASSESLPQQWVSLPQQVTWTSTVTSHPGDVHGLYYPPTNPSWDAPAGSLPPLIVESHGGPTSSASSAFSLSTQYWTSRGFAVLDVDYRGSSGYGRAYRDALQGNWGVLDVADCASGALAMAAQGLADPARLIVRGGSAGGYTTLQSLASTTVFNAGVSYFGIGDLEMLARDTHKFESRYMDGLIGAYPAAVQTYRDRSPIHHLDQLSAPMLLLQGADDKVVPPNQAQEMAAAVRAKGLPVALIVFDGEGHGFRRAETITAATEAELFFYGRVFDFSPADSLPPIQIDNL